jgi:hypothetical protein
MDLRKAHCEDGRWMEWLRIGPLAGFGISSVETSGSAIRDETWSRFMPDTFIVFFFILTFRLLDTIQLNTKIIKKNDTKNVSMIL